MKSHINLYVLVSMLFLTFDALAKQDKTTEISGVLMLDYSLIDNIPGEGLGGVTESDSDSIINSEIRRARINLKHRLEKDWSVKLQLTFDEQDSTSEVGNAYIRYEGWQDIELTLGKFKEPFGLENMTSSKNITFLERSMVSNGFSPGKNKGAMLMGTPNDITWAFSLIDIDEDSEEQSPYAITGRTTWAPISTDNNTWHIGASGSLRYLDGGTFDIDEQAEIHMLEKVIDSDKINTEKLAITAIETAWASGPFLFQSEYMTLDLTAQDNKENTDFKGYYALASYLINANKRSYKNGKFKAITPASIQGAWELTSRYSVLNTEKSDEGSELQTITLGLNYYYDQHIRIMGNIIHSQSSIEVDGNRTGNAAALRVQYRY